MLIAVAEPKAKHGRKYLRKIEFCNKKSSVVGKR